MDSQLKMLGMTAAERAEEPGVQVNRQRYPPFRDILARTNAAQTTVSPIPRTDSPQVHEQSHDRDLDGF